MTKFFSKKLNKRGFTLAELLIVVAILAILIAVAIPIYTGAMQEAQKKVNMSNARALKGAAVSDILMHWTEKDSGGAVQYSKGAGDSGDSDHATGWVAWATFDENGKMGDVSVMVRPNSATKSSEGYVAKSTVTVDKDEVESVISDVNGTDGYNDDKTVAKVGNDVSGSITNQNIIIVTLTDTDVKHA